MFLIWAGFVQVRSIKDERFAQKCCARRLPTRSLHRPLRTPCTNHLRPDRGRRLLQDTPKLRNYGNRARDCAWLWHILRIKEPTIGRPHNRRYSRCPRFVPS